MTSLTDHADYLASNPQNKTAALALADRLQEERDLSRVRSLRVVAAIRRSERDAKDMRRAAELCRADNHVYHATCDVIRDALKLPLQRRMRLVFVPGRRYPAASPEKHTDSRTGVRYTLVSIGARRFLWVYAAALREMSLPGY